MDDNTQAVRRLIDDNWFMTIASSDANGTPWSTPVAFAVDENINFYWVSARNARHSQNIAIRPTVAISIWTQDKIGRTDGVYVEAVARELDVDDAQLGIDTLATRPQPERFRVTALDEVTGDRMRRIYRAEPRAVFRRADGVIDDEAVTVRIPVDIAGLVQV
jgi:uncharacterized protein YhbP (UPF0306 family)